MYKIWCEKKSSISPYEIKKLITKITQTFSGYAQ